MRYNLIDNQKDEVLLVARILMMTLFVLFGWHKLTHFSATVMYMTSTGSPAPELSAVIAVAVELIVGIAIAIGAYTRPLAALMAVYTLITAVIGHHYWTLSDAQQYESMINFYKNVSIFGGMMLLCLTGPGKYSVDRK